MAAVAARTRTRDPRRFVGDVLLTFVAVWVTFAGLVAGDFGEERELPRPDVGPVEGALALAASLPVLARRRAPLAVFVLTAVASGLLRGITEVNGPPVGPTIALFTLAVSGRDAAAPRTAATIIGLFAFHVAADGIGEGEIPTVPFLLGALLWGGAWVLGDRVRMRRERTAALVERAERAERDAERERRLAAAEERTRIARDLHDSAGHAINVILVQAGAARLLQEQDPARARAALETIEEVARETIAEIDQMVRVLRDDDAREVEPPRGLAALPALADRHRANGLDVDVGTQGERRPLSPALDHAAYRILQESLTNAARHGRGSVRVELEYGPDALRIVVTNPADTADARPGHGLAGMRERAGLVGGELDARAGDGVFTIRATLPYA